MRKAYLLIYNDKMGTREEVKEFIDKQPEIIIWRYDIPHSFYLVSERTAEELYEIIQRFNEKRGRFMVCEVGSNKQGWMLRDTWTVLNKKRLPAKK